MNQENSIFQWHINSIYNLNKDRLWIGEKAHYGIHDTEGRTIYIGPDDNMIGCLNSDGSFEWSLGENSKGKTYKHIQRKLDYPNSVYSCQDGSLLVVSNGSLIYKVNVKKETFQLLLKSEWYGIKEISSCTCDKQGNIWISETTGCRVWVFKENGDRLGRLGTGKPGFQQEPTCFNDVEFGRIACIHCDSNNNIIVLDSQNYAIRKIDITNKIVTTIAGNGVPGYDADEQNPVMAQFGSSRRPIDAFDGPWYMVLDEQDNIYVADTQNGVVRMISNNYKQIINIAGTNQFNRGLRVDINQKNPFKLNMPYLSSLDYHNNKLYISDWRGDLVILERTILKGEENE